MKALYLAIALLAMTGCASSPGKPDVQKDALYQSLGGMPGIERLVDAALTQVHGDLRINLFFENTDLADLRRLLIEQICQASGGPCTYTGRSMEEAHSGMNLSEADFAAFVEDLIAAMNTVQLAESTQQQVLGLFGPMKPQVVGQ
ncbi:group I truncated hemoglobin [Tahibacter amnicola]|uniref:Group 1 truncated hemoglobin n=1 Tax=Tahibacter amnicola TaxID=2976241 RepID=A0ABY6BDW6_9GAMM|nr:group 1 truncated hemoglobin [Tahibacter amnicola]UXI68224.1 group 1 truncated hemoglobin [Tahibacter amnicola]